MVLSSFSTLAHSLLRVRLTPSSLCVPRSRCTPGARLARWLIPLLSTHVRHVHSSFSSIPHCLTAPPARSRPLSQAESTRARSRAYDPSGVRAETPRWRAAHPYTLVPVPPQARRTWLSACDANASRRHSLCGPRSSRPEASILRRAYPAPRILTAFPLPLTVRRPLLPAHARAIFLDGTTPWRMPPRVQLAWCSRGDPTSAVRMYIEAAGLSYARLLYSLYALCCARLMRCPRSFRARG